MPRNASKIYKKTNRAAIEEDDIKKAICEIFNKTMSQNRAAEFYNIKRSTLQSRIKNILKNNTSEEYLMKNNKDDSGRESSDDEPLYKYSSKYSVKQVFTTVEENMLEKYIKRSSDINYVLTYKNIQVLAYQYALILPCCKIPSPWKTNGYAGIDWMRSFISRHTTLALRKPESTSLSRATSFNKHRVNQFFENYKSVLEKFRFTPDRIFNLDETGVTTVMKPVKVVSTCGKRQVSQVASAERGDLVTYVGIVNAAGSSIPPVYIFPGVRNLERFLEDAPPSRFLEDAPPSTSDLFPQVLQHILTKVNCSREKPILLLMDNHESHISLNTIKFSKENGIVLLSFPPHTTHKLQPLDVGVFGPFKAKCAISFNDWLISNPGQTISIRNIPKLTNIAYLASFTPCNIINFFTEKYIHD